VRGSVGAVENGAPRLAIGAERPTSGPVFAAGGALLGFATPRGQQLAVVPPSALRGLIQRGKQRLAAREVALPSDSVVPAPPAANTFPASAFAMVPPGSDRGEFTRPYRVKDAGFAVLVMTPQLMKWRDDREHLLLQQRHASAPVGGVTPTLHLDALTEWRGWRDLVDNRKALIAIDAAPDILAPPYHETNEVKDVGKGSVASIALWRDGTRVPLIASAVTSAVANQEMYKAKGKPVPMRGVIVVPFDAFAPGANGARPKLELELEDALKPGKTVRITIPDAALDAVARDFGAAKK
jgi:hypothetical protein